MSGTIYFITSILEQNLSQSGLVNTVKYDLIGYYNLDWGTRWCSWLRHCVTNQKVAVSFPDGVTEIFH